MFLKVLVGVFSGKLTVTGMKMSTIGVGVLVPRSSGGENLYLHVRIFLPDDDPDDDIEQGLELIGRSLDGNWEIGFPYVSPLLEGNISVTFKGSTMNPDPSTSIS